jgi:hypothetical protein
MENLFSISSDETSHSVPPSIPVPVFPCGVDLVQDESLLGFMARMGSENGRTRLVAVASIIDLHFKNIAELPFKKFDLNLLAALLGIAPQEVKQRLYSIRRLRKNEGNWTTFFDEFARRKYISTTIRRFCPAAWNRVPYHRAIWDVKAIPCCLETGQMLLDRCPCGKILRWGPTDLTQCGSTTCRIDLREVAPSQVDPTDLAELRILRNLLSPDHESRSQVRAYLPDRMAALSGAEILELAIFFGLVSSHPNGGETFCARRRSLATGNFISWTAHELAVGANVIRRWPASFHELADACGAFASQRPFEFGFKKHLGPLTQVFDDQAFTKRVRATLNSELRCYFNQRSNLRLCRRNKRRIRTNVEGTINLYTASKLYRVSTHNLSKLREYPEIVTHEGRTGIDVLLDAKRLAAVIDRYKDSITCSAAANRYGIPRQTLQRLAKAGFIAEMDGPEAVLRPKRMTVFRYSSIKEFLSHIEAQAIHQMDTPVGSRLGQAHRGRATEDPYFEILVGLAKGEVALYAVDSSFETVGYRFRVNHAQVQEFLLQRDPIDQDQISFIDAAGNMRIEQNTFRKLAEFVGLENSVGRIYTTLARKDFELISRRFISATEIGERLGIPNPAVWIYVDRLGFTPAVRLPNKRVMLFRAEFERRIEEFRSLLLRKAQKRSS